jgi:O-antigen/teichoic acid export membrane protein
MLYKPSRFFFDGTTSLKLNILANFASQLYVTLIGIVMVPVHVHYMGVEAFGLVGFFAMMQAWFQLLDMGLSPTLAREVAHYRGGALDILTLRRLIRALEGIFCCVAVAGSGAVAALSGVIATNWLKVEQLPMAEVKSAIALIAAIVGLRWAAGLYRSAVSGFERQVWLSGLNVFIATARFVVVIPVFILVGATPAIFFTYQLGVALIEVIALIAKTYSLLPPIERAGQVGWSWSPVRKVLMFSLSMSFASLAWVLVTQTDKLILSKLLTLSDYAYFTLSVLAASGVNLISLPVSQALLPRLTKLSAEGNEASMLILYRKATQVVCLLVVPTALTLALFSENVLWAWTGDPRIVHEAASMLSLYALGNGIVSIAAFSYYLQYAKGDLRLYLIGNLFFIILMIPTLIWAASTYGGVGAGWTWMLVNLIFFIVWMPIVHGRFIKGFHLDWLFNDVGKIAFFTIICGLIIKYVMPLPINRIQSILFPISSFGVLLVAATMCSSFARRSILFYCFRKSF